jgi:hypothetical protein
MNPKTFDLERRISRRAVIKGGSFSRPICSCPGLQTNHSTPRAT